MQAAGLLAKLPNDTEQSLLLLVTQLHACSLGLIYSYTSISYQPFHHETLSHTGRK